MKTWQLSTKPSARRLPRSVRPRTAPGTGSGRLQFHTRAAGNANDFSKGAAQFQRTASQKAEEFQKSAQGFFNDAGKKVSEFVDESKLGEKASKAASNAQSKLQDIYAEAQDNAQRTYWKLDSEYQLNAKARKARRRVEEAVNSVDQQYSVRNRLRTIREDVQRNWPRWKQQAEEFFATTPGKVLLAVSFGLLLSTGVFWSILNLFFILWWLSIPLSLISLNAAQKQQEEAFRQAAEQQARQRQGWGGFPGFGAGFGSTQQASSSSRKSSGGGWTKGGGPVIDAEYTVLSDDEKKRR